MFFKNQIFLTHCCEYFAALSLFSVPVNMNICVVSNLNKEQSGCSDWKNHVLTKRST